MKILAFLLTLAMALGCIASARAQYDAAWPSYTAPTYAEPNQTVTITATVQNTGTATWNPPASGNDFYVQLSDTVGTHIGYVQVNGIAPGQTATVSFNVTIPNIGGNGTATYHLQMMENGIQYFGAIQDVPIIIDYPPTTTLSASATTANLNDSVTMTSTTSDVYANVINQAVDYIPGSGGDWISGTDAAGTRWDGSATSSNQITPSFPMSSTGVWQFRARGQDSEGQLSDFQFVNVTVQQPNTPPTASISASATSITTNQSVTFTISATDPDNNLDGMNMDIRSPQPSGYFNISAGPYSYDGGATPNNGYMSFSATGSNSQPCVITFTQPGTYQFVGSAHDPSGWYYSGGLTITVTDPTYNLSVVNGSASQTSGLTSGQSVSISANAPPSGQQFAGWQINSGPGSFANPGASSTSFTMGSGDATITATYSTITYYLTVSGGIGSGSYAPGAIVSISANPPPGGQQFSYWSVSGPGSFANSSASSTTFTTGSGTATVTANYSAIPVPVVASGQATGQTSTAFSYQITATNSPTNYTVSGLPAGLSLNSTTGAISGAPSIAGNFSVALTATNGGGSGTGTLGLTITFSTGDLSSSSYQYDKTNRLTHAPEGQYAPDKEGNINTTGQ